MTNPIKREIFKNLFGSVADEMGVVLQRTGFSPNIKERLDFSCA
ncbi:MAG: hydantoinase B/oxoprolinase family protein, partial [Candidatus Abyssubacteria bacterium]|nr:hydantoinase B/oxoprolinase family protein [Candidatus Abyssubacteria bacterium]